MAIHTATVAWQRDADAAFTDNRYRRAHEWRFDGGAVVPASSSPHVVRAPWSEPANVDPEEAYIAALASCHMLWFLSLAAADGYRVDRYEDAAQGRMARNADGREWVAEVVLDPQVSFSGERRPDDAAFARLHHRAHEECFLANSVKTAIEVRGRWKYAD
jgi:organic hydroperoxide reductase OsmC/OhrA